MFNAQIFATATDLIKGLAWPAVVAWLIWFLRSEIRAAAKRLTEIGPTGAKFAPPEQVASKPSDPIAALPGGTANATAVTNTAAQLLAPLKATVPAEVLEYGVQQVRRDLHAMVPNNTADQLEVLTYGLVALNIYVSHEKNYNVIYGSQLELLNRANSETSVAPQTAHAIYDRVKALYPIVYNAYSFEQWTGFLLSSGLLQVDASGNYVIAPLGHHFLRYIVERRLTMTKAF